MRAGSAALLVALAGCEAGPAVGDLVVEFDTLVPSVARVRWYAAGHADTWVEVAEGADGEGVRRWVGAAAAEVDGWTEAEARVTRAPAGTSVWVRAGASAPGDAATPDTVAYGEWVEVDVPPAPNELPVLTVSDSRPEAWDPTATFLLPVLQADGSWITVIDREGRYLWWFEVPAGFLMPSARLSPDGDQVVYTLNDLTYAHPDAGVHRLRMDGADADFTPASHVHHDALQHDDGALAWLEWEPRELPDADGVVRTWINDVLVEAEPGAAAGTGRRVYSWADDWGQPFALGCLHAQETPFGGGALDVTHTNSLGFADGSYYLLAHHLDTLAVVAREGGLVAQIGGPASDVTDAAGDVPDPDEPWKVGGPADTWWSHAHGSQFGPDGMVLFDNGLHREHLVSRLVAYSFDWEAHTLRRGFTFEAESGAYSPALGDARVLPGGNVLGVWSIEGMLTEITPEGEVVWRLNSPLGSALMRTEPIGD